MGLKNVSEQEARQIAASLYRYDQSVPRRVESIHNIAEEDIQFYRREGYLVVDRFLTETEVANGLSEIGDILQGRIKGPLIQYVKKAEESWTQEEKENAVRKINHLGEYAPAIRQITQHPGMLKLLERLLGETPRALINQALLKPPFGGGEKPWHQDMAYGNQQYKKQTITAWIALDEADIDNGCMHIIPRSHLNGGVPHFQVRDWQICDSSVDMSRDFIVPLKPGGVLFFSGLLHHGTPANFSSRRRRSLQLRFAPASAELMNKDEFKLVFLSEMTDMEC